MGMFTEDDERDRLRAKLEWVARNILRIKDFAYSGDQYRDGVNSAVDYIRKSIFDTLGTEDPELEDFDDGPNYIE